MRRGINCNLALFALDENNPRIQALQRIGGITAVYENGYVTLCRGTWKMRIMKAENIPLTFGGKAMFMIQNVLAAVIAANVRGISIEDMKAALETFIPSAAQTPGRLNLFEFQNFKILLDYAHNPAGDDKSIEAMTRDDIVAFYNRYYVAANAVIANNADRMGKNLWTDGAEGEYIAEEQLLK